VLIDTGADRLLVLALVLVPVHCMHRGRCHGCFGEETLAEQRRIKKREGATDHSPQYHSFVSGGKGGTAATLVGDRRYTTTVTTVYRAFVHVIGGSTDGDGMKKNHSSAQQEVALPPSTVVDRLTCIWLAAYAT
jgi:hypothetical protein